MLVIAFSVSFMIRAEPAVFDFTLNEADPFFNYRATEFIVENGIPAYLEWHDDMTWYPFGRNVSATSQVMLHVTASTLYQVFGAGSSLYDFTILFPKAGYLSQRLLGVAFCWPLVLLHGVVFSFSLYP